MPELSGILGPFHIISYGTLLGTSAYQTFVGGTLAYKSLPRPQFSTLQAKIFPVYFGIQTILPVVLAITYPGEGEFAGRGPSGISGVLDDGHRVSTLLPLLTAFAAGLANMAVVGPATNKIMRDRKRQETIDGKKSSDPAPHSDEMVRLNKDFGRIHGISSLLNLVALIATAYYGKVLGDRL